MDKTLYYMQQAIEQAEIAAAENEVPVGAVIVRNNEIVATGRNRREQGKNALLPVNGIIPRWDTPRSTRSVMPAGRVARGAWLTVPCTSRWSLALCVPVQ